MQDSINIKVYNVNGTKTLKIQYNTPVALPHPLAAVPELARGSLVCRPTLSSEQEFDAAAHRRCGDELRVATCCFVGLV